jgi:hypothetical protein
MVATALTSRVAGWVVAAALAGALVAVLVTGAVQPGLVAVRGPFPGPKAQIVPGGPMLLPPGAQVAGPGMQVVGPGGRVLVPGGPAMRVVGPGRVSWRIALPHQIRPGAFRSGVVSPFGRVTLGTISSVSGSSFTVTGGGQKLTVKEQSSTIYRKGSSAASKSAVTRGARVAVLGSPNGSQITAFVVVVSPAGGVISGLPG